VEFLQNFLKEVAAREQFSAAVSLLYPTLLKYLRGPGRDSQRRAVVGADFSHANLAIL